MEPLASRLRPTTFLDVVGQEHLVGENGILTKMIKNNKIMSFILYGPPGTGKTTIAKLFSDACKLESYLFNASTDNKARLKMITAESEVLLVIDEIHRMKIDIQDYLLPFVETGKVIIIGMTTLNPYQNINMALRSRCHLFQVKELDEEDIIKVLDKAKSYLDIKIAISDDAKKYIARISNNEVRTAINIFEAASLLLEEGDVMTSNTVRLAGGLKQRDLDDHENHYYELLSALQKSIRGSDVDASIHYLARLITLGDLEIIMRRLLVISYEDIGLANPLMPQKVLAVHETIKRLGLPEARIPLGVLVVDMAISPKSNTGYLAIEKALEHFENYDCGIVPPQADNKKIKLNPDLYHYPHDDKDSINSERYLPKKIEATIYFIPKLESMYEKALSERLNFIDNIKKIKRFK